MDNPYTSQYMPNGFENQDQQGMQPVFQNANSQQAYMNQQLSQLNQLSQPQAQKQAGSISPMDLAKMLRQGGASPMDRAAAYLGTSNTPEMQAQVNQLGSNTWNPLSDYNTGANGWGSYGE